MGSVCRSVAEAGAKSPPNEGGPDVFDEMPLESPLCEYTVAGANATDEVKTFSDQVLSRSTLEAGPPPAAASAAFTKLAAEDRNPCDFLVSTLAPRAPRVAKEDESEEPVHQRGDAQEDEPQESSDESDDDESPPKACQFGRSLSAIAEQDEYEMMSTHRSFSEAPKTLLEDALGVATKSPSRVAAESVEICSKAEASSPGPASPQSDEVAQVKAFLAARGFADVRKKRRRLLWASYPLHAAVWERNSAIVAALLRARADAEQRNSAGLTPLRLARRLNRGGSMNDVLCVLEAVK